MTKRYVIKRLGKGGYWSGSKRSFVPVSMCTFYRSKDEAIEIVTKMIPAINPSSEFIQIDTVYVREDSVSL